jgi:hypothetical protein
MSFASGIPLSVPSITGVIETSESLILRLVVAAARGHFRSTYLQANSYHDIAADVRPTSTQPRFTT